MENEVGSETDGNADKPLWWDKVPPEIWEKCFRYLTPADLTAVARTCRTFSDIASDKTLWRNVDLGHEWGRFLKFSPEFVWRHSAGDSITLRRERFFDWKDVESFLSSLVALPFCSATHDNVLRPTRLDLSGAFSDGSYVGYDEIPDAKSSSDRLARILAPLNSCLETLKLPKSSPKAWEFSFFLSSLQDRITDKVFPKLQSLSGSFHLESMKLLPRLPQLSTLEIYDYVDGGKGPTDVVYGLQHTPSEIDSLRDCHIKSLNLPLFDKDLVKRMGNNSDDRSALESICIRMREAVNLSPNDFKNISSRLRHVSLAAVHGLIKFSDEKAKGLFRALSQLPSLEFIELDELSFHASIIAQFPDVLSKIRAIKLRCKMSREFLAVARVMKELHALESLTLDFLVHTRREPVNEVEVPDLPLPTHVEFPFKGQSLRLEGEVTPRILQFIIHPPCSLRRLEVRLKDLGSSSLEMEEIITPAIAKLKELTLFVDPEHGDQIGHVLSKASSLGKLHILELKVRNQLDFVVEFVKKSQTIEEVDVVSSIPGLDLQEFVNSQKLFPLKGQIRGSRLRRITIYNRVGRVEIIKDCLGHWRYECR